ncbi:MAG: succinate dehydrogenase assembly factor 2 [Pseudomonadota bacterium]
MHADPQIRALTWRCRRGMRELDQLLVSFLNQHYLALSEVKKAAFERLLAMQDPVLFGLLVRGDTTEDTDIAAIIHTILGDTDTTQIYT